MGKKSTRIEMYKEYREEIKNGTLFETKNEVESNKDGTSFLNNGESNQPVQSKHSLDERVESKDVNIFSIYKKKALLKKALYITFVILLLACLVVLTVLLINKFFG